MMNYKIISAIAIGVAGVLGAVNVKLIKNTIKIVEGIEDVSDNIEVEIPDKIINAAMIKAAETEATVQAAKISNTANNAIKEAVTNEVTSIKDELKDSVTKELESKVSMLDIEDIKSDVVKKVSKNIVSNIPWITGAKSEKAQIIKACTDAGITNSWDIQRILEELK